MTDTPNKPFAIANAVKPSKAPITLPTSLKPSFETIEKLQAALHSERSQKFMLENQLNDALRRVRSLNSMVTDLRTRISRFASQEQSGRQ